jgi:hypothetical protein
MNSLLFLSLCELAQQAGYALIFLTVIVEIERQNTDFGMIEFCKFSS